MFISIKYKYIILYSVMTMIPIIIIDTIAYQYLTEKLRNNIIENNQQIVSQANNMITLLKDAKINIKKSDKESEIIFYSMVNAILGRGSEFVLANRDGKVIYTSNPPLADSKIYMQAIRSQLDRGNYYTTYLQVERLAVYSYNPISGWFLVVFTPTDYVFGKIDYIKSLMIQLIIVSIILVIMLIFIISNHLTRPIHFLGSTMRKIENGDFELDKKKKVFIKDEIWQISLSFQNIVNKLKSHMQSEYLFRIKSNEAKFLSLQSQINPHFLHNTLETISSIARVEKVPLISEISLSLSRMFRYNTVNDQKYVRIQDEIEQLENYLGVQLIRFNGFIQKEVLIDHPDLLECKTVKFVLQPIIENCFIHAFKKMSKKGLITIKVYREKSNVLIEINDNGMGMEEKKLEEINQILGSWDWTLDEGGMEKQKVGIYNVNSRIRMAFGKEYGLQLKPNLPNGFSVIVTLPYLKEDGGSNV